MIKLLRLELKNFLSHVDTVLDFNSHEGLVLIEGKTVDGHYSSSNGAGKSTLLEGIVYALTGDTLRGVSVNDVINRNYKKNTRVALSFLKDGTIYEVIRYRKDDSMGDSLVLKEGDNDISKRVNKETQKLLEDTLGISYKILVSTVLLGEGLSSKFTQLSDPEKKSLIESTLNLNYDINKSRDAANEKLKSLKIQEASLSGEISALESIYSIDITSLEDSIYDNKKCIDLYEQTIAHINEEYESLSNEIDSINPKLNLLKDTLNKYTMLEKSYAEYQKSEELHIIERDRVLNESVPVCSLCHQTLHSAESKKSVIDSYDSKIADIVSKKAEIVKELETLPDRQLLLSKAEELSTAYSEKSQESRGKLQEIQNYQVKIAESKKDIQAAEHDLREASDCATKLEEKKSMKESVSKDILKYDYFYRLFSPTGIVVSILSEAIDYINTRLETYSEVLLEKDYHINFVKGKISLVDSKGSSYQSLSNGEKRRLDIAIQFSLHDYVHMYCGMKMNCCFIDEILDTLDDIGVENIFDVLRLKIDYCNLDSIYVITHNNSLKDKFDQVITISKNSSGDSYLS